jgi:hypothetical protein
MNCMDVVVVVDVAETNGHDLHHHLLSPKRHLPLHHFLDHSQSSVEEADDTQSHPAPRVDQDVIHHHQIPMMASRKPRVVFHVVTLVVVVDDASDCTTTTNVVVVGVVEEEMEIMLCYSCRVYQEVVELHC